MERISMFGRLAVLVILFLSVRSGSAQEISFPLPLGEKQRAQTAIMMGPVMRTMFSGDRRGMLMLGMAMNPMFAEGFKKEMGITEEQLKAIRDALPQFAGGMEGAQDLKNLFQDLDRRLDENLDYEPTEEEEAALELAFSNIFDMFDTVTRDVFTEEQHRQFAELSFGMLGGLESSFLWDHSLDVLELDERQQEKLAEFRKEFAPSKKEFVDGIEDLMKKALKSGKINLKEMERFGEKFKETSETMQKRIREILTEDQLAKAAALTRIPKFLSPLAKMVPDWIPTPNSWKPGDGAPEEDKKERRRRKSFPKKEREEVEPNVPVTRTIHPYPVFSKSCTLSTQNSFPGRKSSKFADSCKAAPSGPSISGGTSPRA